MIMQSQDDAEGGWRDGRMLLKQVQLSDDADGKKRWNDDA